MEERKEFEDIVSDTAFKNGAFVDISSASAEYKKKNFDFLVLDLYLPDYKDGFELIKEANRIKNEE